VSGALLSSSGLEERYRNEIAWVNELIDTEIEVENNNRTTAHLLLFSR